MESHLQGLVAYLSAHPTIALIAVFAASLLEALAVVGSIIPGSSFVFVGGMLIGLQALDPTWTFSSAVTGAILGDGISYWLGQHYHERIRMYWPMKAYPALFERGHAYFEKNGGKSIFLGRFLGPLRAIVPVVAGMSGMRAGRFYAINVLSALAWAGAHIVPGVLFGASLQLAGAVSSRLLVMLLILTGALWGISKLLQWIQSRAASRVKVLRDRAVSWAVARSGPFARMVLALLDPTKPESPALMTAAVLLIGSAWLFFGVLEDVVSGDPLVQLDRAVYAALQGLRTQWGDHLMVIATELGSAAVLIPVIAVVSLWLVFQRCWRTLGYWLASVAFAEILVWMLKFGLGRSRPNAIYSGVDQFSFPSGHAAMNVVAYGFLSFLLMRGRSARIKMAIALPVAFAILLIAFSRLYLGVHWFSDVLASLSLGLAWVAILSIAYTYHVRGEQVAARPLALVVLAVFAVAGMVFVAPRHEADVARYTYRALPDVTVPLPNWRDGGWRKLPARRTELGGDAEEPLGIQWAGTAQQIASSLQAQGWHAPEPWTARTAMLWLLPTTTVEQLPVLPKFDRGQSQKLTFVKALNPRERILLRLWLSPYTVVLAPSGATARVWIGMATIERLQHPGGWITLAETQTDFDVPLNLLERDMRNQHLSTVIRERGDVPVVLVQ